ncbi:MAG: hypothetical protein KC619_06215 [Myxococcales bacterium]|nr:hypothetical protein [Myxococcales bacterium]
MDAAKGPVPGVGAAALVAMTPSLDQVEVAPWQALVIGALLLGIVGYFPWAYLFGQLPIGSTDSPSRS